MSCRKTLPVLGLLLSTLAMPVSALQVVASVKPLQLLSAALLEGITEPALLVPPDASVHHYALKPSDMRRLASADLVVWVGPELELFLAKALENTDAQVLQLMSDDLPENSPGEHGKDPQAHEHHENREHKEHHEHHEHQDHQDHHEEHKEHHEPQVAGGDDHDSESGHAESGHAHTRDAHLWMDPQLMLAAAGRMQQLLAKIAPEHAPALAANYDRFAADLQVADEALRVRLAPLAERGFFVFHDAYGHFVDHYGLKQLGYFTVDPARAPGARHLSDIRRTLEQQQAACVFSEPQFRSAVVQAVTKGTTARHAELDPLARDIKSSANGYIDYLNSLGDIFVDCLSH